ncbi:MAG: SDR family oxidoreductase [Candidatus Hodarchaeales archaeon]|jgi:NAD(P)-dependent dehydrogenase (short-subunit alcohol dehydrogenase family)
MVHILITGANRGLGLEFVNQYLNRGEEVVATFRENNDTSDLKMYKDKFPTNLTLVPMDITSSDSRAKAFAEVKSKFSILDILINNAGMTGRRDLKFGSLYEDDMLEVFNVNAISAVLIAEEFAQLFKEKSRIINISSRMGSISASETRSNFVYCASKAALNMFTKLLSNSLREKGIIVNSLHPGWVKTRMGTQSAPIEQKDSIAGMIQVIDSLTAEETGKFFDWQGNEIAW